MVDKVSIFIGKEDDGNPLELIYSGNSEFRTTNTILKGRIGYDRFMWNIAISAVLNNPPKRVLFYDVDSHAHDWTNTIRHYRRVLIKKDETYYSFLKYLLEEMHKEKDKNQDTYTIILLKNLHGICNMHGEIGVKCRTILETLLREGPAHNMCFICRYDEPQKIIEHYEDVFNTEITIEPLFGPGAEVKIKSIQTGQSISRHFTISDIRFRGRLNDYLHRELCGPKYYCRQLRRHIAKKNAKTNN